MLFQHQHSFTSKHWVLCCWKSKWLFSLNGRMTICCVVSSCCSGFFNGSHVFLKHFTLIDLQRQQNIEGSEASHPNYRKTLTSHVWENTSLVHIN